jgi:hypothetical protein
VDLLKTISSTSFTRLVTFGRRHHSLPYSILYDYLQGLHPNDIFHGFPSQSPKIGTLVVPKLWMLISSSNQVYFEHVKVITYSLQNDIFNEVFHYPIGDDLTPTPRGFVVGSQIGNLTLDPSFDHNSCISGVNGQCKGTLGIYTLKSF